MVDKTHTVVSESFPSAAPPSAGAHYLMPRSLYLSIGAANPEDWVLIWGDPDNVGISAGGGVAPSRMARAINISGFGVTGPTAPLTTVTMPEWAGIPYGLELQVPGVSAGVTLPIDLDFSAIGSNCIFDFQGDFEGVTAVQDGAVLKLQVTESVYIKFSYLEWNYDGDGVTVNGIYGSMTVTPLPAYTQVESV